MSFTVWGERGPPSRCDTYERLSRRPVALATVGVSTSEAARPIPAKEPRTGAGTRTLRFIRRHPFGAFAIAVVLVFAGTLGVFGIAGSWPGSTVFSQWTRATDLVVDSSGNFHMVITNGSVLYATNSRGTWTLTPLDQVNWVTQAGLAKDSKDHLHVVEAAVPPRRDIGELALIRYLTNAGGSWSATTLDDHALDPAITVDRSDHVHVAYLWTNGSVTDVRYATNAQGAWMNTTVFSTNGDLTGGSYLAIAASPSGGVHISLAFGLYFIRYITNSGGTWTASWLSYIPSSGGMYSPAPIALDSRGRVHTAHTSYNESTNTTYVVHATNVSGTWTQELVAQVGGLLPVPWSLIQAGTSISVTSTTRADSSCMRRTPGGHGRDAPSQRKHPSTRAPR